MLVSLLLKSFTLPALIFMAPTLEFLCLRLHLRMHLLLLELKLLKLIQYGILPRSAICLAFWRMAVLLRVLLFVRVFVWQRNRSWIDFVM